ncbi:TPA: hypothetical protein IAA68_06920 [Candidatus Galligastranaerophilus faecipullorum]|nr:hypothetical protein [Candidatus Galligastranaerophilus faecipullorum]
MIINAFTTHKTLPAVRDIVFGGKITQNPAVEHRESIFSTTEGQYALKTNVFALHEIKRQGREQFPDAAAEDLKILNDTSYSAPSKRVKWFNPRDCKVYYLLKETAEKDGKIGIRILDEKGKFIKRADIKPKTVVIIDKFKEYPRYFKDGNFILYQVPFIPHGQMVARYAYVNNPFARYILADIGEEENGDKNLCHPMTEIAQKYKDADEINFSWANLLPVEFYEDFRGKNVEEFEKIANNIIKEFGGDEEIYSMFFDMNETAQMLKCIEELSNSGVKVFVSSGNEGRDNFNIILLAKGAQGVGSLNGKGKASSFMSSRQYPLTRHYERGEYEIKETPDGINYTGGCHTDYVCDISKIFKLSNSNAEKHILSSGEFRELLNLKKNKSQEFYKKFALYADEDRIISGGEACKLFNDENTKNYDGIYVTLGEWIPYKVDKKGKLQPYFVSTCGTSYSAPIRAARFALNMSMQDII